MTAPQNCSSGTMTLREQAYRLADNLEGYASKCVHIGSPETVGDLLDAAVLLRTFTVAQASRDAIIEECAQVCEGHEWTRHATHHSPTKSCAIALRALKASPVSSTDREGQR